MKQIKRVDAYEYELVVQKPRLVVTAGETFVVETEDAMNGLIRDQGQLPGPDIYGERLRRGASSIHLLASLMSSRSQTGNDVLVVSIEDIVVDTPRPHALHPVWAHSAIRHLIRSAAALSNIIKHLPGASGTTSDGRGFLGERFSWDLHPFIGTIGTVPERPVASGADSCFGQGPYGGNMDSRDVCKGNRILLPVFHQGAYLYLGDVHASQGDGELYGNADESRAEVTLTCKVINAKSIPAPTNRETPESIIQLNSRSAS